MVEAAMSMLDRLRESAQDAEDDELFVSELGEVAVSESEVQERRILGMNAVERMVLSILVFLATSLVGSLILIALRRIDIGL
jgi:hypothetical protein